MGSGKSNKSVAKSDSAKSEKKSPAKGGKAAKGFHLFMVAQNPGQKLLYLFV